MSVAAPTKVRSAVSFFVRTVCETYAEFIRPHSGTKTSPHEDDDVSKIGLAIFSCSNWQNGYFNAYGNAARKDQVDYFVSIIDESVIGSADLDI